MKRTCLIIDDEPLARKRLMSLVNEVPQLLLLDQCKTGKEAIGAIEKLKPDLIFLDIQMKDMSGFDVLQKLDLEKRPLVIFVTAFDTYAVKAFEIFAFDYLLKPFKKERFLQSVSKVLDHFSSSKKDQLDMKIDSLLLHFNSEAIKEKGRVLTGKIPIKTGNAIIFLDLEKIKYITGSGSYIDLKTENKTYVHRYSLNRFMNENANSELLRIHRSTIINIKFIDKVIHSNFGEIDVKMNDGSLFRVSKSYKKEFQKALGI